MTVSLFGGGSSDDSPEVAIARLGVTYDLARQALAVEESEDPSTAYQEYAGILWGLWRMVKAVDPSTGRFDSSQLQEEATILAAELSLVRNVIG